MEKSIAARSTWFSISGIFSAGLFSLVLGVFLGNKLIAAGQVLLVISLGLVLLKGRGEFEWKGMPASAWWLVAFSFFAIVSILVNWTEIGNPFDYLKKLRYYILVPALLAVPAFFEEFKNIRWRRDSLVIAWLGSLLIAAVIGTVFWVLGNRSANEIFYNGRFSGIYGQVMTFAYILQFSVIALGLILISELPWKNLTRVPKWLVSVFFLLSVFTLYLSETRGALLGIAAAIVTNGLMRSARRTVMVILLLGICASGIYYLNSSSRFFKFDATESERINLWRAAALTSLERPISGLGFRNFELHSIALKERYGFAKEVVGTPTSAPSYLMGHAHNNFLEAFASCGMFGGLTFAGFSFFWLREAWRSRFAKFFVPIIVAFLVSGLFENTFFDSETVNTILLIYLFSQWAFHWEKKSPITEPLV